MGRIWKIRFGGAITIAQVGARRAIETPKLMKDCTRKSLVGSNGYAIFHDFGRIYFAGRLKRFPQVS